MALLTADGQAVDHPSLPMPGDEILLALHRTMVLARRFDAQATALTKQGRRAVAGDDEPVPIGERDVIRRIWATRDLSRKIAMYAAFVRALMERLGGLTTVLAEADPEVAQVRTTTGNERLTGIRAFVGHLRSDGHLPADTNTDHLADACWVLTSPALFIQLTAVRGWTGDEYEQWLAKMIRATLRAVR